MTARAVLTRTNRELLPALVVCLERSLPFRSPDLELPLTDPSLDGLLDAVARTPADRPLLVRIGIVRDAAAAPDGDPARARLATTLLAWAPRIGTLEDLRARIAERRTRLAALRRDDAPLSLATAHGTKGLEFDHVVVLADGFPAERAVGEAVEPERVLEEERRLAYVAWTRARRSLTLLHDPVAPSRFLREAFDATELAA